ncbi:MAG: YeeE/YedE family protein [Candidatus Odinarchaeota archaeon]
MTETSNLLSLIALFSGLPIGIIFGYLIERREFCSATAITGFLFFRESKHFKILFVAIAMETLFFFLLSASECIPCLPGDFSFILTPVGGLLFGVGMIMGAGCASGTCYKTGEGNVHSAIVLAFFGLTGYVLTRSPQVSAILSDIQKHTSINKQSNPTLPSITGIPELVFVLAILFTLVLFIEVRMWQNREALLKTSLREQLQKWKASWWMTASILGLLGTVAFFLSSSTGRKAGLSISSGIINDIGSLVDVMLGGKLVFGWGGLFVVGAVTGAFVSSKQTDQFKITGIRVKTAVRGSIGGVFMGTGVVLTGNCNIGHLFNGIPFFTVSSITALLFIFLGSVVTVKLMER